MYFSSTKSKWWVLLFLHEFLGDFRVVIPFTVFETKVLKKINVAHSELHLKYQTFVQRFEIIYETFGTNPNEGILFSFYGIKGADKETWVSVSALGDTGLLTPYALK